ncbi:hypothetical protein [Pelagicoccus sp. SDUM812002]|uniref:hypothetical protein n=1 Tax=Pelagicoccus sp. SDUM812002 TaxID=3041266 RepID=UPI0028106A5B|nr:hypothetical protein [Pelagicoccus sp. SDUM812002]MDQ8186697.1 hypothetical protein [Pelagicoccus sp. SDUM812002]
MIPNPLADDLEERLVALAEQNETLLKLAQQQQAQIAELKARLDAQASEVADQEEAIADLQESSFAGSPAAPSRGMDRVIISGEAGFAFFTGEANNEFPNEEFRVDDARLTVEAQIHRNAYLVTTLELFRRESGDEAIEVDERLPSKFMDIEVPAEGDLEIDIEMGLADLPKI